jgi:hypothetical protein
MNAYLAGYEGTVPSAATQTLDTTFNVPTANCALDSAKGEQNVSLGGELDGGVMVDLSLRCAGRSVFYVAIGEAGANAQALSLTIRPGDSVTVELSIDATSSSATLTDGSQSQTVSGGGIGSSTSPATFAVGAFRGACQFANKCEAVPKTTKIAFTSTSVSSSSLTGATRDELTDAKGATQMKSGKLTASGSAFSVKWLLSCDTSQKPC